LLHIDLDGNDYWVWKEIEIQPSIVILEYNSVFGLDRPITVPYRANFNRTNAHFSNLYFGASLKAMYDLSVKKATLSLDVIVQETMHILYGKIK